VAFIKPDCQLGQNAETLCVSFEALSFVAGDLFIENFFAAMPEWRMTQVVGQARSLHHLAIHAKLVGKLWIFVDAILR
jgi:hypothetical protein